MEIKDFKQHVKELMAAMGRSGIKRLVIKNKEFEIELERSELPTPFVQQPELAAPLLQGRPFPNAPQRDASVSRVDENANESIITSPMVGTFFTAPSPDALPFVKVGDTISKGDVVCIIEAMKVMNEVKAGLSGTVVEVLVSNGDPVEFGTKLFRVR